MIIKLNSYLVLRLSMLAPPPFVHIVFINVMLIFKDKNRALSCIVKTRALNMNHRYHHFFKYWKSYFWSSVNNLLCKS